MATAARNPSPFLISFPQTYLGYFSIPKFIREKAVPGTDVKGNLGSADQAIVWDWASTNIGAFSDDAKGITIAYDYAGTPWVPYIQLADTNVLFPCGSLGAASLWTSRRTCGIVYWPILHTTHHRLIPQHSRATSTIARYVVQDGTCVDTAKLILPTRNDSALFSMKHFVVRINPLCTAASARGPFYMHILTSFNVHLTGMIPMLASPQVRTL